jgi:SAM-dependent methyltransferase
MGWYSKHDRIFRKIVPSIAKASYNPVVKLGTNVVAGLLSRPFAELRELPPNHLRLRTGAGNRIVNDHVGFILKSYRCWLTFLSRNYCLFSSDVVELGCGCGGVALALSEPWFKGTYVGIDIDEEMIEYCRANFPRKRFEFIISPHKSITYTDNNKQQNVTKISTTSLNIGEPESKDFVFSLSLYSHLLESEVIDYMQETYRILRPGGVMYMTFFCIERIERGQRWTFSHRRGNAYIESARYPEAAVAYHQDFMTELAAKCGFRDITVGPQGGAQTELVAHK